MREITDSELKRELRIAENRLRVLRTEAFLRNGGIWPPVGDIGADNPRSKDSVPSGMNPVTREKLFQVINFFDD